MPTLMLSPRCHILRGPAKAWHGGHGERQEQARGVEEDVGITAALLISGHSLHVARASDREPESRPSSQSGWTLSSLPRPYPSTVSNCSGQLRILLSFTRDLFRKSLLG